MNLRNFEEFTKMAKLKMFVSKMFLVINIFLLILFKKRSGTCMLGNLKRFFYLISKKSF